MIRIILEQTFADDVVLVLGRKFILNNLFITTDTVVVNFYFSTITFCKRCTESDRIGVLFLI